MGDQDLPACATRGAWKGSVVTEMDIALLRRARKISANVDCRVPGPEVVPEPVNGERVVFLAHFERGFGLPVSQFFRDFLDFFRLQPHHLGANAVMLLSAFVTLCEGYLGVRPSIGLWRRFFHLRSFRVGNGVYVPDPKGEPGATVELKVMAECGAAIIYINRSVTYPNPQPPQSIKDWQLGFFYVRTSDGQEDCLNLPAFSLPPPTTKHQWAEKPGHGDTDLDAQVDRVAKLMEIGLRSSDLVAAWICSRVLPLQRRCHRICDMSSRRDPTRISTHRMAEDELIRRVRLQTDAPLLLNPFKFGLKTYDRAHPPPPPV